MRMIDWIVWHYTATPWDRVVTVDDIDQWHKERGFVCIGYHWVIGLEGEIWSGRSEERAGAHTASANGRSIGCVYVGGLDVDGLSADTRTAVQRRSMEKLTSELCARYPISRIAGHRDLRATQCPGFDPASEYRHLLVPPGLAV